MEKPNGSGNGGLRRWLDKLLVGLVGLVLALCAALWATISWRLDSTDGRIQRIEDKVDRLLLRAPEGHP